MIRTHRLYHMFDNGRRSRMFRLLLALYLSAFWRLKEKNGKKHTHEHVSPHTEESAWWVGPFSATWDECLVVWAEILAFKIRLLPFLAVNIKIASGEDSSLYGLKDGKIYISFTG